MYVEYIVPKIIGISASKLKLSRWMQVQRYTCMSGFLTMQIYENVNQSRTYTVASAPAVKNAQILGKDSDIFGLTLQSQNKFSGFFSFFSLILCWNSCSKVEPGNIWTNTLLIVLIPASTLYLSRHFILVEIICAHQSETKLLSLSLKFCQICLSGKSTN